MSYFEVLSASYSRHGKKANGEVDGAIPFEYTRGTGIDRKCPLWKRLSVFRS